MTAGDGSTGVDGDGGSGVDADGGGDRDERSPAFCPQCGAPVSATATDRGAGTRRERALCDACYLERHDVIDAPEELRLLICTGCGAVRPDGESGTGAGEWRDVDDDRDYTDVAVEAVRERLGIHVETEDVAWTVEPEQVDVTTLLVHCTFTGTIRETAFEETVAVRVALPRGTCERCGRIAGDDHSAILQLRARDRSPTEAERQRAVDTVNAYVEARAGTGNRDSFVTDLEESADGVTVKLSTASLGRGIADRLTTQLGGTVGRSSTLVTEDEEGNPVYRVTYAVTLPPFQPDEVIDPGDGGGPVLVRSVRGNLKGTRLHTGEPYESPFDEGDAPDAALLGRVDDAVETTVVAVEDERAVQVLDPESYEAVTIARPPFVADDAATISVLRQRAELHVVPDADEEWPPEESDGPEEEAEDTEMEAEGGGRVDE